MKNILLILLISSISSVTLGQGNTFPLTGDVGIGTTTPSTALDVKGNPSSNWLTATNNSGTYGHKMYFGYGNATINYGLLITGGRNSDWQFDFAVENKLYIMGNGNVGIGTQTPTEKLSVNGKIRAKEIKVEASPWPDYVFHEDYSLLPLSDLEKFIKTNRHLPEIPSAKETEENGVDLGKMNASLLKKVEELTLYLIAQDKNFTEQLDSLRKEIDQLKSEK